MNLLNGQWYNSDGTPLGSGVHFVGGGMAGAGGAGAGSPTVTDFPPTIKGSDTAGAPIYTVRRGRSGVFGGRAFVDIEASWSGHTGAGGLIVGGLPSPWAGAYTPSAGDITGCPLLVRRRIPNRTINLATYGGVPGAAAATIKTAISNALSALNTAGGGTLLIPPGVYDMGSSATNGNDFMGFYQSLKNIRISGYGALFTCNTTAAVITHGITFVDGDNVEVEGLQFRDTGYVRATSWQGAHAIYCYQTNAVGGTKGIRVRDCYANSCLSLFAQAGDAAFLLSELDVQGVADDCYYGIQLDGVTNVNVNLLTTDARRSAILYNCRNVTLNVDGNNTAAGAGSNGWVELAARTGDTAYNVKANLTYRGQVRHGTLVRLEHQGGTNVQAGSMDRFDITLNVVNATSTDFANDAIQLTHDVGGGSTARTWSNFRLRGQFVGSWLAAGKVTNPQVSVTGSSVAVEAGLSGLTGLPGYFSVAAAQPTLTSRIPPQLSVSLLDSNGGSLGQADGASLLAQMANNGSEVQVIVAEAMRGASGLLALPQAGSLRISGSYEVS